MVSNPRSAYNLIEFTNDMKKVSWHTLVIDNTIDMYMYATHIGRPVHSWPCDNETFWPRSKLYLHYVCVCLCNTLQDVTHMWSCVQLVDTYEEQLNNWLTFVSISKVKAFVEIIPSLSVRAGTQTLLAVCWSSFKNSTLFLYPNFFIKCGCV